LIHFYYFLFCSRDEIFFLIFFSNISGENEKWGIEIDVFEAAEEEEDKRGEEREREREMIQNTIIAAAILLLMRHFLWEGNVVVVLTTHVFRRD